MNSFYYRSEFNFFVGRGGGEEGAWGRGLEYVICFYKESKNPNLK